MPAGVRWKAIFVPSGDQEGCLSLAVFVLEMFVWSVPNSVMVNICAMPVRKLVKASVCPSGDHVGSKLLPSIVIWFGFVRSLLVIHMSPLLLKASRFPSGEKAGK